MGIPNSAKFWKQAQTLESEGKFKSKGKYNKYDSGLWLYTKEIVHKAHLQQAQENKLHYKFYKHLYPTSVWSPEVFKWFHNGCCRPRKWMPHSKHILHYCFQKCFNFLKYSLLNP